MEQLGEFYYLFCIWKEFISKYTIYFLLKQVSAIQILLYFLIDFFISVSSNLISLSQTIKQESKSKYFNWLFKNYIEFLKNFLYEGETGVKGKKEM